MVLSRVVDEDGKAAVLIVHAIRVTEVGPRVAVGRIIASARVAPFGHAICQRKGTRVGPLYEQAVDLSPRAARIAAAMLVKESTLPQPLRRSLCVALHACGEGIDGVDGKRGVDDAEPGCNDPEFRAAVRFVEACRIVCARG
jgi:hypothetical protein